MTAPFVGDAAVDTDDKMGVVWPCGCAAITKPVHRPSGLSNEMLVRACCAEHDDPLEAFVNLTIIALTLEGKIDMPDLTVTYPDDN